MRLGCLASFSNQCIWKVYQPPQMRGMSNAKLNAQKNDQIYLPPKVQNGSEGMMRWSRKLAEP